MKSFFTLEVWTTYQPLKKEKDLMTTITILLKHLELKLEKEGYIKQYIQDKWMYIFSGLETFEGEETFEWLKAKNHCIYLIDSLVEDKIILGGLENKIDSKIERFFKIKKRCTNEI